MKFEKPICEISNQDIDGMIEKLRNQHRELKSVERASQKGDVVNINFEGFINGEAFEGGKAEKYDLELGSNSFIPGFEDGLVGRSAAVSYTHLTLPTKRIV